VTRPSKAATTSALPALSGRLSRSQQVSILAAVAGIVAATAKASPTGVHLWDEFLLFIFAFLFVSAAAVAPRWVAISVSTVATAFAGTTWWALVAAVALALSIGGVFLGRRDRLLNAVAAALAIQAIVRWPAFGFFGLPSLIAAVTAVVALVAGYRYASTEKRRLSRGVLAAVALFLVAAVLVGASSGLAARTSVDAAVQATRNGLSAAGQADTEASIDDFGLAKQAFDQTREDLDSIWVRPLRLVPIVSQNLAMAKVAAIEGEVLSDVALGLVTDADLSGLSGGVGQVDLSKVAGLAQPLQDASDRLSATLAKLRGPHSGWIVTPLSDQIDSVVDEIAEVLDETDLAATATRLMPEMLGASSPKTYFVMFGTPAESRELGGFLGSWALLHFDDGRFEFGRAGRVRELRPFAAAAQIDPNSASPWYFEMARPTSFPQNLPSSPDFGVVAEVSRQALEGLEPAGIDGFIYLDAWAIIALLELTGPVQTPLQDAPLTPQNAADFFFRDQYNFGGSERTELFNELSVVARSVFQRLSEEPLPGPERLGRVLGPVARGGHLQMTTFSQEERDLLKSLHLLREFGRNDTTDYVGVVQTNGLSNKLDLYLQRELNYTVSVRADDVLEAQATVVLRSVVPDDAPGFTLGQANPGTHRVLLSLYSPHLLDLVTVNGVQVEHRASEERGLQRYLVDVTLPPTGEPTVVQFNLLGGAPSDDSYSLELWRQPLVNTDQVSVSYRGPAGDFDWSGALEENVTLSAAELAE